MVYRPLSFVAAPRAGVPATMTCAAAIGMAPSADVTLPVMRPVCASAGAPTPSVRTTATNPVRHIRMVTPTGRGADWRLAGGLARPADIHLALLQTRGAIRPSPGR